jgi:SAM-dependent MidA family methyltransferase
MNVNIHERDSLPAPEADALAQSTALTARIHAEIDAAGGWMPFSRYMELALYAPALGYYSGGATKFGYRADDGSDFVTAPEMTPLFGRAFARAVADALEQTGTTEIMEFGAGTGKLAAGMLAELAARRVRCTRYTIVEVSAELRERQQRTIEARVPDLAGRVHWISALPTAFAGVAIGNEVLDAMPVRLYARRGGAWFERGVEADIRGFRFGERPLNAETPPPAWAAGIGHGGDYLSESHDAAEAFVRTVCTMLRHGALLLADYGFPYGEYYHPQRTMGTLMCHYRHRAHGDPFFFPGLQDITAHVDFSGIAQAGVGTGAELLGYTSQARFLINCGLTDMLAEIDPADTARYLPNTGAVQKLLSEAEMGELFKVIAFGRGIDGLDAFARGDRSYAL